MSAVKMTITVEDALRALRHVVAEKGPDHVYKPPADDHTSCVYAWTINGELCPVCIVGCALHYLGVPLGLMYDPCNNVAIAALAHKLTTDGYSFDQDAVEVLRAAQMVQDSAMRGPSYCDCEVCTEAESKVDPSWGAALAAAEARAVTTRAAQAQSQSAASEQPPVGTDPAAS
jgi:hypothetical protein